MNCTHTKLVTPCRLHFGMLALQDADRSFGGLGVMIQQPRIEVTVEPANHFACSGNHQERTKRDVEQWFSYQTNLPNDLQKIKIDVVAPSLHAGLGVGTQMAMAIGASLYAYFGLETPSISELALSMGRGQRSAIGSYGFGLGGFIVDGGREANAPFADLTGRFTIDSDWRFVLIQPSVPQKIFGAAETAAFQNLNMIGADRTTELVTIAQEEIIPAVIGSDFNQFSHSLGNFNRKSGELFAATQGGAYHGSIVEKIVAEIQAAGFPGVGQSSWGPTLFVAARDQAEAERIKQKGEELIASVGGTTLITSPDHVGYRFESLSKRNNSNHDKHCNLNERTQR